MEAHIIEKKIPTVVIVGRTNVGKSTLFNRLIGKREAIVNDQPGVTRDRKQALVEWGESLFYLVDTGGYTLHGQDVFEVEIAKHVQMAIAEADLLLFVVDALTGISDVDGEIAKFLRKGQKPCLVCVNKVDGPNRLPLCSEFIRLGLGEPIPISAIGGFGIGDLLAKISEILGPVEKKPIIEKTEAIHIAILGRPNVGKSTFVNTVLGKERVLVTEIPGTTRDTIDLELEYKGNHLILIDTAGMRRRSRIETGVEYYSVLRTQQALERCDVACVLADAQEGVTQQDLQIIRRAVEAKKGIVFAMNKWDLVENNWEKQKQIREGIEQKFRGLEYVPVLFVSCKTKKGIHLILDKVLEVSQERKKRIAPALLNRFLKNLVSQYQPPAVQGKRIQLSYAVQASTNPPVFVFFSNYPQWVQKNYQRFLEKQLREQFGFQGVPMTFSFRKKK